MPATAPRVLKRQTPAFMPPVPVLKTTNSERGKDLQVLKLEFDPAIFKEEIAVNKFLTDFKWTGYAISSKDGKFTASSTAVKEADLESITLIETTTKGVIGFVGSPKATAAKAAAKPAEVARKWITDNTPDGKTPEGVARIAAMSDEHAITVADVGQVAALKAYNKGQKGEFTKVVKFDYWSAYYSDDRTPSEVLADGMQDGLPPGAAEIFFAVSTAVSNVFLSKSDVEGGLSAIAADMSKLL